MGTINMIISIMWILFLVTFSFIIYYLLDRALPLRESHPNRRESNCESVFEEALL